jgi:hypothetical protein
LDAEEETSLGTDSEDEEEGSDIHKMAKIRHALVTLRQPMTITLKEQYEWNGRWEEVVYRRLVRMNIYAENPHGVPPSPSEYPRVGAGGVGATRTVSFTPYPRLSHDGAFEGLRVDPPLTGVEHRLNPVRRGFELRNDYP